MELTFTKSCEGKKRFNTYEFAKIVADNIFLKSRIFVYPYNCLFCHFWHVGHQVSQTQARQAKKNIMHTPMRHPEFQWR